MTYPDQTPARLIEIALGEVGYIEEPVNLTKYGKSTMADGLPWCGSFVMWCCTKAGIKIPSVESTVAAKESGKLKLSSIGLTEEEIEAFGF